MTIIKRKTKDGRTRYGVRVDRPGRRQEWVGTFDTLTEARTAQATALIRKPLTSMTADAYTAHFLEGYRERVKDSSYDAATTALSKFRKAAARRQADREWGERKRKKSA